MSTNINSICCLYDAKLFLIHGASNVDGGVHMSVYIYVVMTLLLAAWAESVKINENKLLQ
jgi:hypothetical protein